MNDDGVTKVDISLYPQSVSNWPGRSLYGCELILDTLSFLCRQQQIDWPDVHYSIIITLTLASDHGPLTP